MLPGNRRTGIAGAVLALAVLAARPAPAAGPPDFSDLAREQLPAVVNISTTQQVTTKFAPQMPGGERMQEFLKEFFGGRLPERTRKTRALGSGFIIDDEGHVVTNAHVVANASQVRVITQDGRHLEAEVLGTDKPTDLAVLDVDAENLQHTEWGDSDTVEVGHWSIAIGNPFGLGGTVTAGIISAKARDIRKGPYNNFLQTDASINKGNSGGPLFNADGKVIGVNTVILSPSGGNIGIGFAVPANTAKDVVTDLIDDGRVTRGWLGVQIQRVTEGIADAMNLDAARGALVAQVMPRSPARAAGLEPGDVVVRFNGKAVEEAGDLSRLVARAEPGSTARVKVIRDGGPATLDVALGTRPGEPRQAGRRHERPDRDTRGAQSLGLRLAPLTPRVRARMEVPRGVSGAAVMAVKKGSLAAAQGLEPGDVITGVNRHPVNDPRAVMRAIDQARRSGRGVVLLRVNRDGAYRFVDLPLPQ